MFIRSRIKFRHLQCFLEVVRQRSLTKAADALALTQPTVSKTLKELESDLGEVLLERDRSGVVLTPAGRQFHLYAEISVTALRGGFELLMNKRGDPEVSTLRVGCLPGVAARFMPDVVCAFWRACPQVRFNLNVAPNATLIPLLRTGELDVVIGRVPEPELIVGLNFEPLYHERQLFVVRPGHPLLVEGAFDVARLGGFPLLMQRSVPGLRKEFDRFIAGLGSPPIDVAVQAESPDFARGLLERSDAVWYVRRGLVEHDLTGGRLAELPIDTSELRVMVGISTRADLPPQGVAQMLIQTVRSAATGLVTD